MASPSSVLTRGLGSWGSRKLVVTHGFGSGAAVVSLPLIISTVSGRGDAVTLSGRGDTSITLSGGIREDTDGGGIA